MIQFKHNAVPLSSLVDEDIREGLSEIWHNFEVQTVQLLRRQFPKAAADEHQLLVLVGSLQHRTTTKADDEPICLTTLMNIPLEQFGGRPSMDHILGVLEIVPQGLIFIAGPRMTTRGFRWAPRSFLTQRSGQITGSLEAIQENAMPSTLIDRGIKICNPSIILQQGFTVSEKFNNFAKSTIGIGSGAGNGIRASVDLDNSCN